MLEFIGTITENDYLGALVYFGIYLVVIGILAFVLKKIFLKITLKTKTDLDDLLVQKLNKPILVLLFLTGLRFSLERISVEGSLDTLFGIVSSFIVIGVIYFLYVIFDLSFSRAWIRLAKKTKRKPNDALIQLTNISLKIVLVILGLIYILNLWGVEVAPLLAGVGIGGIAIAFALQNSLGNIFGGISIILDKSIRVGDFLTLENGTSGKVTQVGLRSTKILTRDNESLIVPNSKLSESIIHNVAMPEPKSRVIVPFSVAYGSDIEQVKKIVMNEIKKIEWFVGDPAPFVRFMEMGDSSLKFKTYFFVSSFDVKLDATDEANTRIYNALNKAGIEIPFPHMDVRLKK